MRQIMLTDSTYYQPYVVNIPALFRQEIHQMTMELIEHWTHYRISQSFSMDQWGKLDSGPLLNLHQQLDIKTFTKEKICYY